MSLLAPGSYVAESAFPSFNTVNVLPGGSPIFVGAHNRGPLTPVLVRSWQDFQTVFGGFSNGVSPSALALGVYSFFNNGGGPCYVLRIVHADAVAAANVLDSAGATPAATLDVAAISPGAWGNNIYVVVTANTVTNTFNLAVYYGGTAAGNLAEPVWTNLSMNPADNRYAPAVVNNPNNGSTFIRLTDANATPSSTSPLPAAATTQLGTGTGSTVGVDGSAVTSSDLVACTAELDTVTTPLIINFPGVTDVTNVINPMVAYCQGNTRPFADSIVVADPPSGQTPAQAQAFAGTITASSYVCTYYPWITVSDPASQTAGALRTLPPGAFAIAKMVTTDATRGVWKAPAGYQATISGVGLERYLAQADMASLTGAGVNCVLFKRGAGLVLWGDRTLSNQEVTLYLHKRRTLIYIEGSLKALSEYAVFEDNDYFLWSQLSTRLGKFLSQLYASGAFAGSNAASSFYLVCDDTNNNSSSSTVNISAGVALADPAEFIQIQVGQWQGGSTVTESPSIVTNP